MKVFCLMILTALLGSTVAANAASTVQIYRWNPGFRVESEPVFEMESTEEDFSSLLAKPEETLRKNSAPVFTGCYVVKKSFARSIASAGENQPALYRICLHQAQN
ncbi:MAG: hypothetical protein AB7K68_03730 [Bacteriovoracia bacterium]